MTGNIIGEKFDDGVLAEIKIRQKTHGSGFNNKRTPQQIQFLNNRNAWLKLASSVYILGESSQADFNAKAAGTNAVEGTKVFKKDVIDSDKDGVPDGVQRLKDIGLSNTEDFIGNQLAQKCILFNTLSEAEFDSNNKFVKYNQRSGVTKSNSLWNSNNSYGLGGSDFGLSPAPGLIDASVTCVNRGSIRKAKVSLKAYNKFQFDLIELLYLRLGYTMMLEWGFDKYLTSEGKIEHINTTVIEDDFFKTAAATQKSMLQKIDLKRTKYQYNYDGFFGKVTNFDWSFNPDGTYDISIDLITLGDVIESINARNKVLALTTDQVDKDVKGSDGKWLGIQWTSGKGVGEIKDSNIVGTAGDSQISYHMYQKIKTTDWENRSPGGSVFGIDIAPSACVNGPLFSWEHSRSHWDGLTWNSNKDNYPAIELPNYNYYMTMGELFLVLQNKVMPLVIKQNPELQLDFDVLEDANICNSYPNLISLDPKICLIKPKFYQQADSEIEDLKFPAYLSDLKDFNANNGNCHWGKIMNIYINFEFIAEVLQQTDKEGKLNLFNFLTKILEGINKSLGNIMQLEVIIKDDVIITVIDQNPIANLGLVKDESFEIFGFNTANSGSSNFVTDFSFETNITPDLASQISIGATAQGSSTKNTDATAFSKWNIGLMDRTNPSIIDSPGLDYTNEGTAEQDAAWDSKDATVSTPPSVGNYLVGGLLNKKVRGEALNLIFSKKNNSVTEASLQSGQDYAGNQDEYQEATQVRKNLTYKGVKFSNVTYYTFLTLSSGLDVAINVKNFITDAFKKSPYGQAWSLVKSWMYDESQQYASNYQLYLVRAFGGKAKIPMNDKKSDFSTVKIRTKKALYTTMADDFVNEGHQCFNGYANLLNEKIFTETGKPSPRAGFIPIKLSLTFEGMSGIKIYNGMALRQQFLPPAYNEALKFIIDKVDHKIGDNNWTTSISTLAVPDVENKPKTPFTNMTAVKVEGGEADITANTGPIDPGGLFDTSGAFTDDPLKIMDYRSINGNPVNINTYKKEITISTAVSYMNKNVQSSFKTWYNNMLNEGYNDYVIKINAIFRPFSRSVELKEQNPSNAAPGKSVHNYAAGVDINIVDPRGRTFMKKQRNPWIGHGIVAQAEKAGIQWGGNFGGYVDSVHFYVQFNRDTALVNAAADNPGKPQKDWDTKDTKIT